MLGVLLGEVSVVGHVGAAGEAHRLKYNIMYKYLKFSYE
jgi:hypothetical protein